MHEKIRSYLAGTLLIELGDGPSRVREDQNLFDAGLIDSFAFVELVGFLEREFKIKITDGEALSDALSSYANITAFVEGKVRGAGR
jgi:acyl carrier protein